jgi:uncharacterized protein (DUF885 family)
MTFMHRLLLALLCLPLLAQSPVDQLNTLYEEFFEFGLREFPEGATAAGRTEYNDRWTDYSPAAVERRRSAYRDFLERARRHSTASLPAPERMHHRLFVHTLERGLESIDFGAYYAVASHIGGLVRQVLGTIDSNPRSSVCTKSR